MNEKDLIEWLEDRGELMVMKKDGEIYCKYVT